jgi:mono/diheme cytochrome c family protein
VSIPRWITYTTVVLVVLSWIPIALLLRARNVKSAQPRIHLIQDMDNQPRVNTQARNPLFADRRGMRPPVPGTVARGALSESDPVSLGLEDGENPTAWVEAIPIPVTMQLLSRGQQRYDIFCSPCHGLTGFGDGMVSKRADQLQEGTWTPPTSFHTDLIRSRPAGQLFNTITNGVRNMPAYGPQIPVDDRWAIVAYVRALQRSQAATVDDVPGDLRASLR